MREKLTIKSKKLLALLLAFAVILCSLTTGLAAFAEESETVSFILDATTNGGSLDGEPTMRVEAIKGATYTTNVTVMAPTGQQFVGWSTKSNDYVGELSFVPEDSTTYYAIFAEVIYVGGTVTDANADKGTKANPYTGFGHSAMGNALPFKTNAKSCIAVLSGTVTLASISNWSVNADKHLHITGLDPTNGVQNQTAVTLSTFALGNSGQSVGVFDKGVSVDNCTIVNVTGNPAFYLRHAAKEFKIGTNVEYTGTAQLHIDGVDINVPSVYIESGMNKVYFIRTAYQSARVISGDATVVMNGGYAERYEGGIVLSGAIGGNASVVINDYTAQKALRINTATLQSVGGAINYIFNNGTKSKIAGYYLMLNCDNSSKANATVPTTGGFYYIDSGVGGKVMPTETAGKFKVEFDEGYNYVIVNGNEVKLDSNNCFTVSATDKSVVTPTASDWITVAYGYKAEVPAGAISFTLDASTNGGTVDGDGIKIVQVRDGDTFTNNVTVAAPAGQQFVGWSTNKDALFGDLTFIPANGKTYYAIFAEVIYVGGTATDATAAKGTKANPYTGFSASAIGNANPFKTTSKNCIAVLDGAVTLASISNFSTSVDKRLYITGLDPTTGVKNTTSVNVSTFATGVSGQVNPIFKLGLYIDHITVTAGGNLYIRGNAANLYLGMNVDGGGLLYVTGADNNLPSAYIESGAGNIKLINVANQTGITISGNETVVINGGKLTDTNNGVKLGGNVTGNASVVVNGYDSASLRVNTAGLQSVGGSVNYIFNNGTKAKIEAVKLFLNCTNYNTLDTAVPTTAGFYYIDSAAGGKVLPTETAGKFKVEFDEGYNYIMVNGERVELDSNNCFTLTATASTVLAPAASDWYKITYHYEATASEDNIVEVPVNYTLDLSKIGVVYAGETNPVNGGDVTWDACKLPNAEIANGKFIAFGEDEILVTATYAGKSTGVTFKITADAAVKDGMIRFASNDIKVARVGDNTYTVTVTETEERVLKYGTLKNAGVVISDVVGTTGTTFKFTTTAPQNMSITAEFITAAERANGIFPLGAGIRPETDEYTAAIRFVTRFTAIQKHESNIDINEEFVQAGVLMIPEILWDGTYPEASALVVEDSDEDGVTEVKIGNNNAQNLKISKLRVATELFSDAAAAMYDLPAEMRNVKMVAIPYMLGADGTVTYMDEADINPTSFGEIFAKEFPLTSSKDYSGDLVKEVFALIGTNHELDEDPNSNAISYELGEEITFTVVTAGNYAFEYALYKDNNGALAEYGEAAVSGVETCVKQGAFDPAKDGYKFTLTTRLDNPGTVRLAIKVKDAGGTYLTFKGDKNLSVTAAAGADQIALPSYMVETEENMDAFYSTISTNYAAQVERIEDALKSTEMVNWFMGSKTKGEVKKYADAKSDLFEITYVGPSSSGIYDQYTVVLATVESIPGVSSPLTSADLNTGKFPYNDYLKRPSTFMLTVPAAAGEDSCPIISGYYGYGTNAGQFEWNAGTISVSTTAHGLINLQAQSYYDKAVNILYNEGGTKGGIMYDYENQTDPTKLYAYGMLVRDYLSLQFAKFMPQFDENSTITTKGGSQGGFQAVGVAAADEDVDICNSHITWLTIATIAGDQFYDGWTPAYTDAFKYIMSQNAVVSIGNRPGFVLNIEAALSDQTCPLFGLLAMYNTSKTKTTFVGHQFSSHNYTALFAQAYGDAFTVRMNKN